MNKNQSIGIWVVIGIITASLIMMLWPGFTSSTQEISYTNFLKKVENQEIVPELTQFEVQLRSRYNEQRIFNCKPQG